MKTFIQYLKQTNINEANNAATMQAVPPKVLGNVNPATGERESGVHEYDSETGEKTRTYSGTGETENSEEQSYSEYEKELEEIGKERERREEALSDVDVEKKETKDYETFKSGYGPSNTEANMARRFPEAYPSVFELHDKEGNPTGRLVHEVSRTDTTISYGPEAMKQRMLDWAKSGADDEEFKKTHGGSPWDTQTTETRGIGIPLGQKVQEQFTSPFIRYLKESAAWTRKEGKDPEGGLNKKGVASYRRENPGSKLQTAVTEDPKKLKKGSKKAKRRKSFCKRMKGMKKKLTSAKTARDPDSRINKALRKWNCE
jgi:hypothetical protein